MLSFLPVHPRLCGEHLDRQHRHGADSGSSPLVRGTYNEPKEHFLKFRFIPACAGNILQNSHWNKIGAVHPRLCGEHYSQDGKLSARSGSSPLVRGTSHWTKKAARQRRFIPACAGNISIDGAVLNATTVHPRLCGEHTISSN